jgi:serpin B
MFRGDIMKLTHSLLVLLMISSVPPILAEEKMPESTSFSIDLYHQLDSQVGNLFFSPLSIRTALAMTSSGAKGKTLEEMQTVLRTTGAGSQPTPGALMRELQSEPKDQNGRLLLRVANAIWVQKRYPLDPAFVKTVREQYDAQAQPVDFANEPAVLKEINGWVEEKTNKKIVDLIPSGLLQPDTRLVLTNAVYFLARWLNEFNPKQTTDQPFHVTSDKTTTVPMMRQTSHFDYAQTPDFEAIRLMYEGFDASMLILLPKSADGIAALEKSLSADGLKETLDGLENKRVDLSLPKFRIEQASSLAPKLQAMGMKLAFDPDHADFGGICSVEPLFISDVLHKAFVKVDEEGTEAAAATAVVMRAGSAMREEQPIRVVVDHPFHFIIRHEKTGEILFMGRVMNPAGE